MDFILNFETTLCYNCDGYCEQYCPIFNSEKKIIYSPKIKNVVEIISLEDKKNLFNCIDCNLCKKNCPFNIDPVLNIKKLRERWIKKDNIDPLFYHLEENIYKYYSIEGDKEDKKIIKGLEKIKNSKKSSIVFIPDPHFIKKMEYIDKIESIFVNLGQKISIDTTFMFNFNQLYQLGYIDEFITDIKKWIRYLKNYKIVIIESFSFYNILKNVVKFYNIKVKFHFYHIIDYLKPYFIDKYFQEMDKNITLITPSFYDFKQFYKDLSKIIPNITTKEGINYPNSEVFIKLFPKTVKKLGDRLQNLKNIENLVSIDLENQDLLKKTVENIEIKALIEIIFDNFKF